MFKKTLLQFVGPLIFLLVWQTLSQFSIIDPAFFPSPLSIFDRFFNLLTTSESFLQHLEKSLMRLSIALLMAVPSAIALAVMIEFNQSIKTFIQPLISILYPLPKVAIFPLLLLIFGIGDAAKIAVLFLGMFFLILLSVAQGLRRILQMGYFDIAYVYRIPKLKTMTAVAIRGVLPEIINGVKIAIGNGLILIVASEFTIADRGIGVFIWSAWDQFQIKDVYVGILTLSLISFVAFQFLEYLEKKYRS